MRIGKNYKEILDWFSKIVVRIIREYWNESWETFLKIWNNSIKNLWPR